MPHDNTDGSTALDTIAAAVHETWRALARQEGWSMQPHLDRPFADLAPADQDDNRAAARRIPAVLALAGLDSQPIAGSTPLPTAELSAIIGQHMEAMAEAEHDGWMAHRAATGWRHGPTRDDARKLHPAMIPYAQLPEKEKQKDRNNVRHYPDFLARAQRHIVPKP